MSRKKCTGCGKVKDFSEFSRDKSRKDGLQSQCKSCFSRYREENREAILERKRRHYEENRESERDLHRRWRDENREAVLEYHRRYYEENREVHNKIIGRRQKAINDAMREIATRNGEPWTPAEDAYIMSADEPGALMAMELGRTIASIRGRAARLRKKTAA